MFSSKPAYIETGRARAKINLTLHVGRAIEDGRYAGYHPVDSLVVFAGAADRLAYSLCNKKLSLELSGLFGANLKSEGDNLVLRAARAFYDRAKIPALGSFRLEKCLPLASGMGGGSADAAAVLRLLFWEHCAQDNPSVPAKLTPTDMMELAENIGADVPVCYLSQTSHMSGIGEVVTPIPNLGRIPAILVNPGFDVSTPEIFKAFDQAERAVKPTPQLGKGDLLTRAKAGRNDLQDIAINLRPEIGDIIARLSKLKGCQLARMTGSGATCFAIFENFEQAVAGRDIIMSALPHYWCRATLFGDVP